MSLEKQETTSPKFVRSVTRWQIVGLSVNDVIGSGVYLLPAAAALLLGVASIWAVFLAGCAVAVLVLCFAEASSYFDEQGGAYLYTREAFGEFIGFEVGWMTWLARVTSVATLSVGFALACSYLWPGAAEGWGRAAVIIGSLSLLTFINVIGVKHGAKMAVLLTIVKSIPLVLFIGIGIFAVQWDFMEAEMPLISFDSMSEAVLLVLFAYVGFESTPGAAGEFKNPKKDIPFALLAMVILVTLTYTLVQLVAVGSFPGLATSESPLAASSAYFAGAGLAIVMTLGAMVSILGNMSNTILMGPRYLYALAKDGYGFKTLAKIHPRYRTPTAAIIVQSSIALVLALSGSFVGLAMLSIIARIATYAGTAAAVPILRKRFPERKNVLKLPGGYLIPVVALIICMAFVVSTGVENLIAGAIALAVGAIIYYFRSEK